ncbi:hypothetical protein DFJ63DRAFT_319906 [Scheffersomyces coipomensis]|uniref:uncharacterized protein n=1 Tax=Scheffersomyces coipomensis TaxID=1788519 RepID=UPI00315C680A
MNLPKKTPNQNLQISTLINFFKSGLISLQSSYKLSTMTSIILHLLLLLQLIIPVRISTLPLMSMLFQLIIYIIFNCSSSYQIHISKLLVHHNRLNGKQLWMTN